MRKSNRVPHRIEYRVSLLVLAHETSEQVKRKLHRIVEEGFGGAPKVTVLRRRPWWKVW